MLPIEIYKKTYEDAFKVNQVCINDWTEHREKLEQLKNNLENYPKELSHEVLVPLGKKALIRGKLVHTNEILIKLGSDTFIKRTAQGARETCGRIINHCDNWIEKFEKEQQLLSSNFSAVFESDALASSGEQPVVDISEPYDEETEKEWRSRRKKTVNQCRLEEKEKAEQVPFDVIMKELEEYELQEKSKNELDDVSDNSTVSEYEDCEYENTADDRNDVLSDNSTISEDDDCGYENITDDGDNSLSCVKDFLNITASSSEIDDRSLAHISKPSKNLSESESQTVGDENKLKSSSSSISPVKVVEANTITDISESLNTGDQLEKAAFVDIININSSVASKKLQQEDGSNNNTSEMASSSNKPPIKKVSFSKGLISKGNTDCSRSAGTIPVIYFKHHDNYEREFSPRPDCQNNNDDEVDRQTEDNCDDSLNTRTPADIVNLFCSIPKVEKSTKSILKKTITTDTTANITEPVSRKSITTTTTTTTSNNVGRTEPSHLRQQNEAFTGEIVLRSADDNPVIQSNCNRVASKFKVARSRSKNK